MCDCSFDYQAVCPACGRTHVIHGMFGRDGMSYRCDECSSFTGHGEHRESKARGPKPAPGRWQAVALAVVLAVLLLAFVRMALASPAVSWVEFVPGSAAYTVEGKARAADAAPFIDENGRLLVPVRFLARALGVEDHEIVWDGAAQSVRIAPARSPAVQFTLGSAECRIIPRHQGAPAQVRQMDTVPVLLPPGRVFLPARYLAEALGWGVWWDERARTVTLVRWDPDLPAPLAERLSRPFYWVAYNPTHYDPESGVWPDQDSIRADLAVLRRAGFRGLVTYGLGPGVAAVPRLAKEAGFEAVIAGLWDFRNGEEMAAARQAAPYADAFCVGNEGLLTGRYRLGELLAAMKELRLATGRPVTTSEPVHLYFRQSALLGLGDFLLPIVHPYWAGINDAQAAAEFTAEMWRRLAALGRRVLVKETGLPSAGDAGLSEQAQLEFYRRLSATETAFAWFEAFDQAWKVSRTWVERSPVETHWGLFDAQRRPKAVARWFEEQAVREGLPPHGDDKAGRAAPGPRLVFTRVPPAGSFEDEKATRIAAFLVPADYRPPLARGEAGLPREIEAAALARAEVAR